MARSSPHRVALRRDTCCMSWLAVTLITQQPCHHGSRIRTASSHCFQLLATTRNCLRINELDLDRIANASITESIRRVDQTYECLSVAAVPG